MSKRGFELKRGFRIGGSVVTQRLSPRGKVHPELGSLSEPKIAFMANKDPKVEKVCLVRSLTEMFDHELKPTDERLPLDLWVACSGTDFQPILSFNIVIEKTSFDMNNPSFVLTVSKAIELIVRYLEIKDKRFQKWLHVELDFKGSKKKFDQEKWNALVELAFEKNEEADLIASQRGCFCC